MTRKRKIIVSCGSQSKRRNESEEEERKSKRRKHSPLPKKSCSGQKQEQHVLDSPPALIIINDPYRIQIPTLCTPSSFKVLPTPTKSETDTNLYRLIQLSNGVIALLISNLEDEKSKDHKTDTNTEEPIICTNNNTMETIECNLFDETTKPNNGSDDEDINVNLPRNHDSTFHSKNSDSKLGTRKQSHNNYKKCSKNSKFKYHQTKKNKDSQILVAAVVKVGSYSNPIELPGLAHFVEHMVHLGSHQFPNVKDFKSLLRTHGCSSNAKTSGDYTTFQYNIYPTELERSLEMFSRFFIDPIFDVQWIKKEIWNLDNEFTLARSADTTHRWELLRTLIKDGHPMKNFTCGNFESLTKISNHKRNSSCSDDPDYPFVTLQEELKKFHLKFYTAENLSLVIRAPLQLDEMEKMVVKYFSNVQKSTVQINKQAVSSDQYNPYDMSKFHQYYRIESISGCDKMYMTWCLPSPTHFSYLVKAQDFLCELVKSSHLGGLKDTLYKKRWISNFAAFISQSCKYSSLFVITLNLTEKGLEEQKSILEIIFSYMDKLQNQNAVDGTLGVDYETFYQRLQQRYQEKFKWSGILPDQNVNNLALNIFKYNPQDILSGQYLFTNYDAIEISTCQKQLSPQRANIMLFTNKAHVCHLKIPYSNMPYLQEDIPPTLLSTSNHEVKNVIVTLPKSKIKLAIKNKGHQKTDKRERKRRRKKTFFSSPKLSVDYRQLKGITNHPQSFSILVKFQFRKGQEDCVQHAIKVVWINLIKLSAGEFGLPTSVKYSCTNSTISFHLYGFYPTDKTSSCCSKMKRLLLHTSKILKGDNCEFKELEKEYFEASKVSCMKHLHKLLHDSIRAAENLMDTLMDSSKFSAIELLNSVQSLDFNFFHSSIRKLHTYMKIFVDIKCNHTNCSCPQKAEILGQFIRRKKLFNYYGLGSIQKLSLRQKAIPRIMKAFPRGESTCRIRNMNHYCSNSVLMNCYQIGLNSKRAQTICNFIMTTMNYPAFFTIRSYKTIGYSVSTRMNVKNGILLIIIRVVFNSERFSMTEVENEVNDFLQTFYNLNFRYIDDETFNKMKHVYWRCEGIEKINLRQVQDWFFDHLLPSGHSYKKLSIQIVGNPQNDENNSMKYPTDCMKEKHEFEFVNYEQKQNSRGDVKLDRIFISNLLNFKKTCKLYPKSNAYRGE